MGYHVARSIQEFDAADWDLVAGSRLIMTHRWQQVMEHSRRNYQPRYLLVEDAAGPLAAVIANAAEAPRRSALQAQLQRLTLVVSAPFSALDCGVAVRPGIALADALPQIEQGLQALAWQMKRPLLAISNVSSADLPTWHARGYATVGQEPYNLLELHWPTYAAYQAACASKQRSELRRMRRRAASMEVRFEHGPLRADDDRLYPLLAEVFAHHGVSASQMPFTAELFPAFLREMPGEVMLFKGFVGDELAGYMLCLVEGDTVGWPAAGLHYPLAHPSYLYFLLIDEMIQWSIAHGYRRITGGLTNEREKHKFGFVQCSRSLCLRTSPALLNVALATAVPLAQGLMRRGALRSSRRAAAGPGGVTSEAE